MGVLPKISNDQSPWNILYKIKKRKEPKIYHGNLKPTKENLSTTQLYKYFLILLLRSPPASKFVILN